LFLYWKGETAACEAWTAAWNLGRNPAFAVVWEEEKGGIAEE
jgi:hypothetical protein